MLQVLSNPLYLTPLAALSGVILTVVTTRLTAQSQRRHDRLTKLFDTKMSLYAEFADDMNALSKRGKWLIENRPKFDELQRRSKETSKQLENVRAKLDVFTKKYGDVVPGSPAAHKIPAGDREEMKRAVKDFEEVKTELAQRQKDFKDFSASFEKEAEGVDDDHKRLMKSARKVQLVGEPRMQKAVIRMIDKVSSRATLDSNDFDVFIAAARAELGVKSRRWAKSPAG